MTTDDSRQTMTEDQGTDQKGTAMTRRSPLNATAVAVGRLVGAQVVVIGTLADTEHATIARQRLARINASGGH
jgi:hypothetical protein